MPHATPPIDNIAVRVFRIPTDAPEADGTIAWTDTTMVVVTLAAGGKIGIGYTYATGFAATEFLAPMTIIGRGCRGYRRHACRSRVRAQRL